MPVNTFAAQIRTDVDDRLAARQQAGLANDEVARRSIENELRRDALLQIRCYELWLEKGRPLNVNLTDYLEEAAQTIYTTKRGMQYRADVMVNTKEALGFL